MPFANSFERNIHFVKHGHKFGAADALEYERMADQFMYGLLDIDTHECTRPNNVDYIRFGFGTHYEGIICMIRDVLRTFYPVEAIVIARHGGETNYFAHECSRITL